MFLHWLTCAKVLEYDLSGSFRQSWGTNSGNWVNWWALARIQLYTSSMKSALSLLHFKEALLFWTTIKCDFSHVTVKLRMDLSRAIHLFVGFHLYCNIINLFLWRINGALTICTEMSVKNFLQMVLVFWGGTENGFGPSSLSSLFFSSPPPPTRGNRSYIAWVQQRHSP